MDMQPILFESVNNRREKPESLTKGVKKPESLNKGVKKPAAANAPKNARGEEEKSETGETKQKSNYKKRRRKKKTSERKKETNIGSQSKKADNMSTGKKWNKIKPKD
jgi:hypothetical protein